MRALRKVGRIGAGGSLFRWGQVPGSHCSSLSGCMTKVSRCLRFALVIACSEEQQPASSYLQPVSPTQTSSYHTDLEEYRRYCFVETSLCYLYKVSFFAHRVGNRLPEACNNPSQTQYTHSCHHGAGRRAQGSRGDGPGLCHHERRLCRIGQFIHQISQPITSYSQHEADAR